jgi:hypothetical protein
VSTSAIPATIDYLVTTFAASTRLGAAVDPVKVYDGPQVSEEFPKLILWIGLDDPDTSPGAPMAATSTQAWVGPGNRWRDELFDIMCVAEAWSGDTDVKTARVAAYAIVAAVEDLTRADANLGGNVLFINPGVTGHTLRQNNTSKGAVAQVQFLISCKARIGSAT